MAAAELGDPDYRRDLSKLRAAAQDAAIAPANVTLKHIGAQTTGTHDYSDEHAAAESLANDYADMVRGFDVLQSPNRHIEAAWRVYDLVSEEQAGRNRP